MPSRLRGYYILSGACFLIGLYPSIYFNVAPYFEHSRLGMAASQLVISLLEAILPFVILRGRLSFKGIFESLIALALLCVFLFASVGNGMESITLARSDFSADRDQKKHVVTEWTAQIETWNAEQGALKKKYVPIGDTREYLPTTEENVHLAQEGRDAAIKARDACKYECKALIQDAKAAQDKLERVAQNYELTKRVDALEKQIAETKKQMDALGAPSPDHIAIARDAQKGAYVDFLSNREATLTYAGEAAAAFGPKFLIMLLSLLYAEAYGESWKRESPSFKQESLPELSPVPPSTPQRKKRGLIYIPGVKAWVESVRPLPGSPGKRYAPGQALSHYQEFCRARDFPYAPHATVLGGLLKNETDLRPVVVVGGMSLYELCLRPQLALVKETA